jgi:hypothetical protein
VSTLVSDRILPAAGREVWLDRFWRGHKLVWLWASCVAIWVVLVGVPSSRPQIFAIIGLGLVASCWGTQRSWKRVVVDWLPLYFLLFLYDVLRGFASTWLSPHSLQQIAIDRWLFGGTIPTVSLQHALYTPGVARPWDYVAFAVYLTHFFLVFVAAAYLWKFSYERFKRFAVLLVALTFSAFVTYALYPAMPPWLASRDNALQPTAKIIDEMWSHVGMANGAHVLSATGHLANPIAAVPSLHAAYPMLLMLFFWASLPKWRLALVAYVLAMAFTLIYTGEHYVIDILLGWTYASVVFVVGSRVLNRYQRTAPEASVLAASG